jgi:hypothetical protein
VDGLPPGAQSAEDAYSLHVFSPREAESEIQIRLSRVTANEGVVEGLRAPHTDRVCCWTRGQRGASIPWRPPRGDRNFAKWTPHCACARCRCPPGPHQVGVTLLKNPSSAPGITAPSLIWPRYQHGNRRTRRLTPPFYLVSIHWPLTTAKGPGDHAEPPGASSRELSEAGPGAFLGKGLDGGLPAPSGILSNPDATGLFAVAVNGQARPRILAQPMVVFIARRRSGGPDLQAGMEAGLSRPSFVSVLTFIPLPGRAGSSRDPASRTA